MTAQTDAPPADAPTEVAPPPQAPRVETPRSERGVLVVRPRVVERLAEASMRMNRAVWQCEATVLRLDDGGVDLSMDVVVEYPRTGVGEVLAGLRRTVAADVGRMLGRPVRRLDIVVDGFGWTNAPRRRID
jgi:hypothetical protein